MVTTNWLLRLPELPANIQLTLFYNIQSHRISSLNFQSYLSPPSSLGQLRFLGNPFLGFPYVQVLRFSMSNTKVPELSKPLMPSLPAEQCHQQVAPGPGEASFYLDFTVFCWLENWVGKNQITWNSKHIVILENQAIWNHEKQPKKRRVVVSVFFEPVLIKERFGDEI